MAFMVEHLADLARFINECQEGSPTLIVHERWQQVQAGLQEVIRQKEWHPRVADIMEGWEKSKPSIAAILDATNLVLLKMKKMEDKHTTTLQFLKARSSLDPRNIKKLDFTWQDISSLLSIPEDLREDWEEYVAKASKNNFTEIKDLKEWWAAQPGRLAKIAVELLCVPMDRTCFVSSFLLLIY